MKCNELCVCVYIAQVYSCYLLFFCWHKLGSCHQSYKTKLHFTAVWIWRICKCSRSQRRFIELKNKSSLSVAFLQRAYVCVCSSVHTNMWIKAAGWDGFGSDVEVMGRLTNSSLPHGVFIHRLSSMQSSWACCFTLSSGGAFWSLLELLWQRMSVITAMAATSAANWRRQGLLQKKANWMQKKCFFLV